VRRTLRLPLAIVAAIVVAEVAVFLLRPRDRGPEPVAVEPRAYFTSAQLEKAEDYRTGQIILFGVRLAVELGVLVLVVRRPPRRLIGLVRRPVLAGAVVGAALSVAVGLAPLPVRAIARERAKDVGLVTQGVGGWLADVARSEAIGAGFAGAGGALLVFGMRRFRRRWWIPGAGLVVAFGAAVTYVGPVVLDPVFNRFEPLPAGQTRSDVLELARRADVDVGEVYEMDASRRTTAANAYVTGLGHTKRVVIYDTLLEKFSRDEVRLVVAHELGHVHHRDLRNGLIYLLIVAPLGTLATARLGERLAPRDALGTAAAVPAVALSLALLVPAITAISNQLSRDVEARADAFSLELTGEPQPFIGFERRLVLQNVSDPDPPGLVHTLLGTHPTAIERIGMAEAAMGRETDPD
jgi:STE24 endopeptidase